MDWFQREFGFVEDPTRIAQHMRLDVNDAGESELFNFRTRVVYHVGRFTTPSVRELRAELLALPEPSAALRKLRMSHIVANVADLIKDPANAGALFQVASQFNCLEMSSPERTPRHGVTGYAADSTQGPACALACPAATLFRNYFVNGVGQCAAGMQLNLLTDVAAELDNAKHGYWRVVNGYCLEGDAEDSVARLRQRLCADAAETSSRDLDAFAHVARASLLARRVMDALRVGVHWNTSVSGQRHTVAQVLCAAVPVSYSRVDAAEWQPFATTVLNAAYEATLSAAALLAVKKKQRQTVFLTALGGGAFGNSPEWIRDAMARAIATFQSFPLDVHLVHFGRVADEYRV